MWNTASSLFISHIQYSHNSLSPFMYLSLGRHSTGALESLGMPTFQFLFLKDGLKTLKNRWSISETRLQREIYSCSSIFSLTMLSTCSTIMFPTQPRINSVFCLSVLLLFPLKNCTHLSDKTAAEYFLCCASPRVCFDWQPSTADFLTAVVLLTLSLLWPLNVCFVPFRRLIFFPLP